MDVRRAIAALLLLGLLVSCSDDEPSSDPPEPTGSVTPSSTAPVEPKIPAEARGTDEASAKAFVRYWFEVFSSALDDGDVTLLRVLSTNDCVSCRGLAGAIAEVYAEGGRYETAGWKVERIARLPGYEHERPDFLVRTRHTKRDQFGDGGELVHRTPMALIAMRAVLVPHEGSWQVKDLEELK